MLLLSRQIASWVLLGIGVLMSLPASVAIWQERMILDEDNFVGITRTAFADDDVENALADRLTAGIMQRSDIRARIDTALASNFNQGAGGTLRSDPLLEVLMVRLAEETIHTLSLRFLQSDAFAAVRDLAIRGVHRTLMAIVRSDRDYLEVNGNQVVLDLRAVVDDILSRLDANRLQNLQASEPTEEAGRIVITTRSDYGALWTAAKWIDDIDPIVPIATAIVLGLSLAISPNRRRTLIIGAAGVGVVAALAAVAIAFPVRTFASGWPANPQGQDAANAIYGAVASSFVRQQVVVVAVCIGVLAVTYASRRLDVSQAIASRRSSSR
jgi:hypothetical protein